MRNVHLPIVAACALVLAGCVAQGHPAQPARSLAGVAPRYQPAFLALKDAVDAHEDESARRIVAGLAARLATDRARQDRDDADVRDTDDALALLEGFERLLDGRLRVDAIVLELAFRPLEGEHALAVVLRATTEHYAPLTFRPGAALLTLRRTSITPSGKESHDARSTGVSFPDGLVVDPDGVAEVPLGKFPLYLPGGSIASRTTWSLTFRSGDIVENDVSYPAMNVLVRGIERTDLASFIPNAAVEPLELANYAARHDVALAPILERTVRILPEHREDALDLLTPVVERSTPEETARLVPTLRWLSCVRKPGSDPLAWKVWLVERRDTRTDEGPRPELDISGRGSRNE